MVCGIRMDDRIMDKFIIEYQWEQVTCIFMHKNVGLQSVNFSNSQGFYIEK